MDYIELCCTVDPLEPWREILIAQLAEAGFESFEETPNGLNAYIQGALFDNDSLAEALSIPGGDSNPVVSWEIKNIETINWNTEWELHFEPITIGDKVVVRAPFHESNPHMPFEIIIEPRMSFGTGHHETTRLIIEWMLETEMKDRSVLDMGCGTGILAIVAAKMEAARVVAIDNYLVACENAAGNMGRNGLTGVVVRHGDAGLLGDETFDVILANITRNVLLEDMKTYKSVLNPGGMMFLSGFLEFDGQAIIRHAASLGLVPAGEKKLADWVGLKLIEA